MFSDAAPWLSETLAGYPWPVRTGQSGLIRSDTNTLTATVTSHQVADKGRFPKMSFDGKFGRKNGRASMTILKRAALLRAHLLRFADEPPPIATSIRERKTSQVKHRLREMLT